MQLLNLITLLYTLLFVLLMVLSSEAQFDCECLKFKDSEIPRCPGTTAQLDLVGNNGFCSAKLPNDVSKGGNCHCYGCTMCWDLAYSEEMKKGNAF
jgi:hypothetical protein